MIAAAVFIIGEMAGSGILTLPSAIARESKYDFWFTIQKKSFSLVILVVLGNAFAMENSKAEFSITESEFEF